MMHRQQADSRAIVPHESVVSRGTEAFSYLDGDEAPSNGVQNHERDTDFERPEAAPRSPPQLPTLAEEPTSPSLEGWSYTCLKSRTEMPAVVLYQIFPNLM
jgi:hypothetical protein